MVFLSVTVIVIDIFNLVVREQHLVRFAGKIFRSFGGSNVASTIEGGVDASSALNSGVDGAEQRAQPLGDVIDQADNQFQHMRVQV